MAGAASTVRPATACTRRRTAEHRLVPDGDSADLLAYGRPDHGVALQLGRCRDCGIGLLSLGAYMSDFAEHTTVLELPDAALPEE